MTDQVEFPFLLLLVSGGHTQYLLVKALGEYERLGTTIDDAIGEAFDKTAKLLGLPYPGGPAVEKAAKLGDPTVYKLPRPLLDRPGLDMSFAGLKTAVRTAALKAEPVSEQTVNNLCASFQEAVADVVGQRSARAFQVFRDRYPDTPPKMVIAGGVAANEAIRTRLNQVAAEHSAELIAPPHKLCTDNAAMIAWAGAERLRQLVAEDPSILEQNGKGDDMNEAPRPRWPLDKKIRKRRWFRPQRRKGLTGIGKARAPLACESCTGSLIKSGMTTEKDAKQQDPQQRHAAQAKRDAVSRARKTGIRSLHSEPCNTFHVSGKAILSREKNLFPSPKTPAHCSSSSYKRAVGGTSLKLV